MAKHAFADDPQQYGVRIEDFARGLKDGTYTAEQVISCFKVRMSTRKGVQWQPGGKKRIQYSDALKQVKANGQIDVNKALTVSVRDK